MWRPRGTSGAASVTKPLAVRVSLGFIVGLLGFLGCPLIPVLPYKGPKDLIVMHLGYG